MLTVETQRLYPLRQARRAIKDGFFGFINPYLVFQSRVRTEILYLSLIGIILRWGFLIWELIFYLLRTFVVKEETTQKKNKKKKNNQDEDYKSAINKKLILNIEMSKITATSRIHENF